MRCEKYGGRVIPRNPDLTWVLAAAGAAAERTAGQVPRETTTPAATITGKGTAVWKRRGTTGTVRAAGL